MTLNKRLLPVLASVSLFAAACTGPTETATTPAPSTDALAVSADPATTETIDTETTETATTAAPPTDDTPAAPDSVPAVAGTLDPAADIEGAGSIEVLNVALGSLEESSYSFQQGTVIQGNLAGELLTYGSDETLVTGQVDGDRMAMQIDNGSHLGPFFESVFESVLPDTDEPWFDEMVAIRSDLRSTVWAIEGTAVMDLEDLVTGLEASSFSVGATDTSVFSTFAWGPVSVDLGEVGDLVGNPGIGVTELASQFGQVKVFDPAHFIAVLQSMDEMTDAGTDSVDGVEVVVYSAEIPFGVYSDVVGPGGLGVFEELLDVIEQMDQDPAQLDVDVVFMVDADGFARQITTTVDVGAFLADAIEVPDQSGEFELVAEMKTWQTFANYGDEFDFTPPVARDSTEVVAGAFYRSSR